jgi:hypothetical protein
MSGREWDSEQSGEGQKSAGLFQIGKEGKVIWLRQLHVRVYDRENAFY